MRCRVAFAVLLALVAWAAASSGGAAAPQAPRSLLTDHLLVTWYGNPRSRLMGVLGEQSGDARAAALRRQANEYVPLTTRRVLMAYHLVAVVAQCTAGNDGLWRRRETRDVIDALLAEARENGFRLVLDVQPGRSPLVNEVASLAPFLRLPDVDLAIDPEFHVTECEVPGRQIGQTSAADVNAVLDLAEQIVTAGSLPPKALIVHQFRTDMLPDKAKIRTSRLIDVVLNMDGFGSRELKRDTYRSVMRLPLRFAGIKLFYRQDTNIFTPADVMRLNPKPSVVVYQ